MANMIQIPRLNFSNNEFPLTSKALDEPNGLLAFGGDLSPERLLTAYHQGIFPWFNPGDPILWWSPNPRTVLIPNQLHISKSLRKTLRKGIYSVSFDQCFTDVMHACAAPRRYNTGANGTWISEDIITGYSALHQCGIAHSVEVWLDDKLVGGLYGVALGKIFFGESMFSLADNASKVGFAHLVHQLKLWDFQLIDCQVANEHLFSLGAIEITREEFQQFLLNFSYLPPAFSLPWPIKAITTWD
jgi:leucyl/phenylalanyl-tRNA---protein transferase